MNGAELSAFGRRLLERAESHLRLRALAARTDSALVRRIQQWRWNRSVSTTSASSEGSTTRLQYAHFALAGGRPHVKVVVWRRQLAQVAVVLAKGSSCPTVVVTTRISTRLTAQANARQASHNGSPGHCSSNLRTVVASSVRATVGPCCGQVKYVEA